VSSRASSRAAGCFVGDTPRVSPSARRMTLIAEACAARSGDVSHIGASDGQRLLRVLQQVGFQNGHRLAEFAGQVKGAALQRGKEKDGAEIVAADIHETGDRAIFGVGRVGAEIVKTGITAVQMGYIEDHHAAACMTVGAFKGDGPEFFGHGAPPCVESTKRQLLIKYKLY
jgi:hypothetical protein